MHGIAADIQIKQVNVPGMVIGRSVQKRTPKAGLGHPNHSAHHLGIADAGVFFAKGSKNRPTMTFPGNQRSFCNAGIGGRERGGNFPANGIDGHRFGKYLLKGWGHITPQISAPTHKATDRIGVHANR